MILFVDGVTVDRLVGFDNVADGNDTFTTKALERRLFAEREEFKASKSQSESL